MLSGKTPSLLKQNQQPQPLHLSKFGHSKLNIKSWCSLSLTQPVLLLVTSSPIILSVSRWPLCNKGYALKTLLDKVQSRQTLEGKWKPSCNFQYCFYYKAFGRICLGNPQLLVRFSGNLFQKKALWWTGFHSSCSALSNRPNHCLLKSGPYKSSFQKNWISRGNTTLIFSSLSEIHGRIAPRIAA